MNAYTMSQLIKIKSFTPFLIILAGAMVRLVNFGGHPFWYDEAFTRLMTLLPVGPMIDATAHDFHPPLYYLIMQFADLLPGSIEIRYRLFSYLCSFLAMVVLWLILRDLKINRAAALISLAIMAASPMEVYYAQEARMYAMLVFLVLLQVWAGITRRWVLLEFTIILTIYTHNFGLIYSGVVAIAVALRELAHIPALARVKDASWSGGNPADAWHWTTPYIIPAFVYLPWLAFGLWPQITAVAGGHHWMPAVSPGDTLINLFWAIMGSYYPASLVFALFMITAAGIGLIIAYAIKARQYTLLALAFGPWLIAALISIKLPMMLFRYLIPSTPFVYILVGLALASAGHFWKWVGSGLLIGSMGVCLGCQLYKSYTDYHNYTLDTTMAFPAGVPIIHLEDTTLVNYAAYHPENQYFLDAGCPEQLGGLGSEIRGIMGIHILKLADLPNHYYFVASVNPLSRACHEAIWSKLTHGAKVIKETKTIYTIEGIYYVGN